MQLSDDILSKFAKLTVKKTNNNSQNETTHFATVVDYNGGHYVKLDGSEQLTPVITTTTIAPGERVTVLIKNHSATVIGNVSSPSAKQSKVEAVEKKADKAIISSAEEFYHSDSPTELIGGEGWSVTEPSWKEGKYIWRRTKNTYGDGTEDYTPSENGVCITGNTGQDSILLYIDSSNGTVFKNNSVSTVLSVVIYYGSRRITDADEMKKTFGESAFLQWKWKMPEDEDYIEVARDDYRIKGDGFTLTLSPDDVTIRATFSCELNI